MHTKYLKYQMKQIIFSKLLKITRIKNQVTDIKKYKSNKKTKQPILIQWQRKIQEKNVSINDKGRRKLFVHHQATASTSLLRKKNTFEQNSQQIQHKY